jgi:hypothetical protein
MNAKYLILGLFMIVLMSLSVAADRLEFGDVEADVDGEDTKDLEDGDRIGDEAVPGSKVKLDIEVRSNFTDNDVDEDGDEIEIQNIEVTVTVESIDDGDDLDFDFELDDLKPGDDDSGKIDFIVPLEVGNGDYDIKIEVEGEDTNNTDHRLEMNIILEVDKEKHEVRITRASLSPSAVSCGRSSQLALTVLNTGDEDEEDVELSITGESLGLELSDTFDIDEGEFDEDMEYSRTFPVPVDKNMDPGAYPVDIRVVYDDGGEETSETVELLVNECTAGAAPAEEEEAPSTGTGTTTTTTGTAGTTGATTVVVAQPSDITGGVIQPTTTTQPQSLFDNKAFLAGIVIVEVVIVVGGIALVAYLMRRS